MNRSLSRTARAFKSLQQQLVTRGDDWSHPDFKRLRNMLRPGMRVKHYNSKRTGEVQDWGGAGNRVAVRRTVASGRSAGRTKRTEWHIMNVKIIG